ncbi:hypothetical protein EAX61_05310 [Dokdonia sinensis]|uniref:Outer membrane protein beta-barrel domain-containing protein n=1 Tax=Dokdonia sinensis TaxID=2479847 RepID=A0A3M0GH41_9FLAO|nr:hypothetical protein [Dokdonia sinensis]RMB60903.1 hypothetical protein EAX61_05310 [Dokdonia sinensis]
MKKLIFTSLLCVAFALTAGAQEISKNAIGLRIGDSDGFGTEVSYQRALGDNNRLELDLGFRNADDFNAYRLTGLYQWVWNIDGGFNWYAGAGGGIAQYDGRRNDLDFDQTVFYAAGDIGIEYNFDFPLLLSLDFRPEFGINNDVVDDFVEFDIALGIRYQF